MVLGRSLVETFGFFFHFLFAIGGHIGIDSDRDVALLKFFDMSFIRLVQTIQMGCCVFFFGLRSTMNTDNYSRNILGE